MTNKILYETHLEETGEILNEAEWLLMEKRYSGKMRKFESYWDAIKRYGIIGLVSYITGAGAVTVTGGLLSVPIGLIFYAGYRKYTDKCTEPCNGTQGKICFYICYLNACKPIIKEVYKEIQVVKKSEVKQEVKVRVLQKLNKELIKWVERYNKYEKKIKKFKLDKKKNEREHKQLTKKARARYYGGII